MSINDFLTQSGNDNLKNNLVGLDLSGNAKLQDTDFGIKNFRKFVCLKKINLRGLHKLTGLNFLPTSVEDLDISLCSSITDFSRLCFKDLDEVQEDFQHQPNIYDTEQNVQKLTYLTLKTLKISSMNQTTKNFNTKILKKILRASSGNLKILNLSNNPEIVDEEMLNLIVGFADGRLTLENNDNNNQVLRLEELDLSRCRKLDENVIS